MLKVLLYHSNEKACDEVEHYLNIYALKKNEEMEVYKDQTSLIDLYKKYGEPFSVMTLLAEYVTHNSQYVIDGFKEIRQTNKDSYLVALVNDYENLSLLIKPALKISGVVHSADIEGSLYPILDEIVEDYNELSGMNSEKHYSCWSDGELYRIPLKEIIFFERQARSVVVRTKFVEIPVQTSLEKLEESLGNQFYRVHKSFLLNTEQVTGIQTQERLIGMKGGYEVPVSKKNFGEVKRKLILLGNQVVIND